MALFKEPAPEAAKSKLPPWKIAIIDDDPAVHDVTKLALRNFEFEDRSLDFLSAFSGEEGMDLMSNTDDIALAFVDVVMETDDAGLKLIEHIRQQHKNNTTRIVLRTGQPGQAPEEEVIRSYDINDYKAKTELSAGKLKSCVYTAIRSYRDIRTIELSKRGMEGVIQSSSSVLKSQTLVNFGTAVLKQTLTLLNLDHSILYFTSQHTDLYGDSNMTVLAASGDLIELTQPGKNAKLPAKIEAQIAQVLTSKTHYQSDDVFIGYYPSGKDSCNVLYVKLTNALTDLQKNVLEMFASNVALVFENLTQKEDIQQTQKELIMVLSDAIELRSKETGGHVRRVALMTEFLAKKLALSDEFIDTVRFASALHDVGKISIPEHILHKPGKLDAEEWQIMKTHAQKGHDLLANSNRIIAKMGAVIAKTHHECWDGSGYPNGLAGEEIPIEGRLMAVADVIDALMSRRSYKPPWSIDDVKQYIAEKSGTQFDPQLVSLALKHFDRFVDIRDQIPDDDE
ncbi:DUF3369 domain-containing protein [Neiella marina]|uniref:DUF3369 domain-containing protein n=1 Tax=Neiella holothuriorum TaxID=2870530 RepID=A0ABS7EHH4_9GAMM|nr:DUF3369 domain-containing protein [Neiella holothuriorum]MBW8191787.1 DUF3369 domain-containing protein [Neiella holothuriorum]